MIELGMIRDLVTIFGVIAAFTYYALTVRNANEARIARGKYMLLPADYHHYQDILNSNLFF